MAIYQILLYLKIEFTMLSEVKLAEHKFIYLSPFYLSFHKTWQPTKFTCLQVNIDKQGDAGAAEFETFTV